MIRSFRNIVPTIAPHCFIADSADVIGNVTIGEHSSVWFQTVIRGDVDKITIGHHTNIQDLTMIHVTGGMACTNIGNYVTIGHSAVIHGCTIGDRCLIGMNATILDYAVIGEDSIVAAGAVVSPGIIVPPRSMVMGVPGKVKKTLSDEEVQQLNHFWQAYIELKEDYLREAELSCRSAS
jgi:carbonic anhydrase/acetyltransferase-like protein (isoleucine patch superfamily)